MNPLFQYIEKLLVDHLKTRRVAVWYDPRSEFKSFVNALSDHGEPKCELPKMTIGDIAVSLALFEGSFFGIKAAIEPLVDKDLPDPVLLYLPGVSRDKKNSVLMELEKGGVCFEWQLKRISRFCLREKFSDGVIDGILSPTKAVSYEDIVGFLTQNGGGEPSILKVIFEGARDNATIMASWLSDPSLDKSISEKHATPELFLLIASRMGLELEPESTLEQAREKVALYVLVSEFRDDLSVDPPFSVAMIPQPQGKDQIQLVGKVAESMREKYPKEYARIAGKMERDLALAEQVIDPSLLAKADTFPFEEKALSKWVGDLILQGKYDKALSVISERGRSFWADRAMERQSQWTACRLMARLGALILEARQRFIRTDKLPSEWVAAYCGEDGWHHVDLAQQQMEAWVAKMIVEPEAESSLEKVRQIYEDLAQDLAIGFMEVLAQYGWSVSNVLHQTEIYPKVVDAEKTPVAYFSVDAMRYSMAQELIEMLPAASEVLIRPAVAAWPTITPVGMAALLPGASAGFKVTESAGKLAAEIEGSSLPDVSARLKFIKARIPGMVEMQLEKLLQISTKKLQEAISGAPLILVRSQEIDALGEMGGALIARQVMYTMVGNVARAARKLADCGIARFVVTSDHGHLFTRKKDDAFKIDPPGGKTLAIHRRCWIGQGGTTPTGAIRFSASEMGYNSDLEFVFPKGIAVFKSGGDLGYHHGGLSLQEMIIPVVTFRMGQETPSARSEGFLTLSGVPDVLTNRTFGIHLDVGGLFSQGPCTVRPLLLSKGIIVGKAGMALDGEYQQNTGCVTVQPLKKASIAMILENEECKKVTVIIQDPATDRVLAKSHEIPVKLGTL